MNCLYEAAKMIQVVLACKNHMKLAGNLVFLTCLEIELYSNFFCEAQSHKAKICKDKSRKAKNHEAKSHEAKSREAKP